ncbi:MAG TPA: protein-tyrosine phosphatase family protein [Rhizomicrobium sp.]|nr:protein-tyrosine phosphatase family protein [Rhizomicrobium sp.]
MSLILVTSLSAVEKTIAEYRPSHMITLLSPEYMIDTPRQIAAERHLRLAVNDVLEVWAGDSPPNETHVARLIEFGRTWDSEAPMLVHCLAGISRSMAAAYTLLCDRAPSGRELDIARELRARAAHACPNALIVALADQVLGREGRMVRAVATMGRGEIVVEGGCVELPLALVGP